MVENNFRPKKSTFAAVVSFLNIDIKKIRFPEKKRVRNVLRKRYWTDIKKYCVKNHIYKINGFKD